MARFESRGAHERGEQWNTRDMMVYTGSGLREGKNPTSCVCRLYYDCLGQDPLYPSFYRLRGLGFTWKIKSVTVVPNSESISTCPIYKI
jgi:hypothetical protein